MRYFSMFSGIGGFEVGIEEAFRGMGTQSADPEPGQAKSGVQLGGKWPIVEEESSVCSSELGGRGAICVGYSEIDRYASAIYRGHFPAHRNFGDATKLDPRELPDFDLLVGGFPCQAFSIAGKRAGFMDARGTLFFEIARVLEHKRPRYFLLENVEGLLSHDDRKTIVAIIRVLSDLGYRVSWQVLNTKDYGLPQNRERIFIAGRFGGERGPEVFPISEANGIHHGERGQGEVANCLDSTYGKGWRDKGQMTMLMELTQGQSQGMRVYSAEGLASSLVSRGGGSGAKYAVHVGHLKQNGPLVGGEIGFALRAGEANGVMEVANAAEWKRRIRRLTPVECEFLQGFSRNYTKWGVAEGGGRVVISDTQRYKCLGNAVSTNVIARIISGWKELQEQP